MDQLLLKCISIIKYKLLSKKVFEYFLPQRDYVTFGLCYRKSICCLSSVTFVRLKLSVIFLCHFVP